MRAETDRQVAREQAGDQPAQSERGDRNMPVGQGRSSGETPGTLAQREQARQRRVDAGQITAATAQRQRDADNTEMNGRYQAGLREQRAADEAARPAREAAERTAARERAAEAARTTAARDAQAAEQRQRTAQQAAEQRAPAEREFADQVARGEVGRQRAPWSKIPADYRTGTGADRRVMVAGPGGSTMVPWYGPEGARGSRTPPGLADDAPDGPGASVAEARARGVSAGAADPAPDADAVDSDAADLTGPARRQGPAAGRLVDVMPRLNADQAETVLARAREAGLDADDPVVKAGLARLAEVGGKRRTNAAAKWFGADGDAAERRATRGTTGTVKQQQQAYAEYVHDIAAQLEDVNRGGNAVRRRQGDGAGSRSTVTGGDGRPNLDAVLTSNAATIKARLSPESLEKLAEIGGPPLSFDAWRYEYQGARDARAVESYQRRTAGYFSEYG